MLLMIGTGRMIRDDGESLRVLGPRTTSGTAAVLAPSMWEYMMEETPHVCSALRFEL